MWKKRRYIIVPIIVLVALVILYVVFTVGKYSFMLGKPALLFGDREEWLVARAREQALEDGIPPERLQQARIIPTVKILFNGGLGTGGVEIIVDEKSGMVLEMSY